MAGLLDTKPQVVGGLLGLSEPQKAGVFDYALAALAGGGIAGAAALGLQQRQQRRAYQGQSQRLAQLGQQAEAAGLTPQERFSLSLDPAKALEMLAERTKPRETAGGNSVLMGGKFLTAPKVGVDGGYGYAQTPEGIQWQAQRGINHDEVERERANMADEEHAKQVLGETTRHNKVGEGIDWGQLGVARGNLGVAQGNLGLSRQRLALKSSPAGKPPTEAQATAGFNAARLQNAAKTLNTLEGGKFDAGRAALTGPFRNSNTRSYDTAANEWSDALIRLTTGAAATKDEIEMARKTYFPQVGDPESVRQQKASARAQVMSEASRRAGPAAPAQIRTYNPNTGRLE